MRILEVETDVVAVSFRVICVLAALRVLDRSPGGKGRRRPIVGEMRFEGGNGMRRDGFRSPTLAAVGRTNDSDLIEQVYLVRSYAENLPGHRGCGITREINRERRDQFRSHLFELLN